MVSRNLTPNGAQEDDLESVEILTDTQSRSSSMPLQEDASWEDEPDYNLANPRERSPVAAASPRSARKRKTNGKKIFVAQPSPSLRKFTAGKARGDINADMPPLINIDRAQLRRGLHDGTYFTVEYFGDVLRTALQLLRKPLALALSLYLLALLLTQISSMFRVAFAPICWIPIISSSPLCYTPSPTPKVPKWADYPKLVDVESSTFEKLLDETVGGSGLSLEIKKAEMATSDLVTLVKVSDLKTKSRLAEHLEMFVDDSKKTGKALQRLSSRVSGAIDRCVARNSSKSFNANFGVFSIMAVNDHALQTIQQAQSSKKSLTDIILWPVTKSVSTRTIVAATFSDAMSVLEAQIRRIRLEAEASAVYLDKLEESLITLHEMLARENITLTHEKDELLADLWTILGGNRHKLKGVNSHLWLLRKIGDWRMRAQVHVVATIRALDAMSEDMEDLRERVGNPALIGESVPPEVHMKSIQAGLDRLKDDRKSAKEREEENMRRVLSIDTDDED